jgi:hypothetical protein
MRTRRQLLSSIFVPVFMGSLPLFHVTQQPRFQLFHNVDVLQLLASGMCFGVALSALVALIRGPRSF